MVSSLATRMYQGGCMPQLWRRSALILVGLLIIAGLPVALSASGQDSDPVAATPVGTPASGATATFYLPSPNAFGDDWRIAGAGVPGADPAVFATTASAIYLGPDGARVQVRVYQNRTGRVALNRSWEQAGREFEIYANSMFLY